MVNATIIGLEKLTLSNDGVCQQQVIPSSPGLADQTTLSLSNRGIETTDLYRFIKNDNPVVSVVEESSSSSSSSPAALSRTEDQSSSSTPQSQQQSPTPQISSLTALPLPLPLPSAMMMIIRLDLSRNKLTSLPEELFGGNTCPILEFLDVGRNQLKGLPSEIRNCKQLKTLIALSNNIRWSEFPVDAIASLPLLEVMDLRWNRKMNSQSSRSRLLEFFPEGGCKNQTRQTKLILSPTNPSSSSPSLSNDGNSNDSSRCNPFATTDDKGSTAVKKKLSACDRDANDLQSQLEPISTPQLRKRICRLFGVSFDDEDENAYDREVIMQRLLQCYNQANDNDNDNDNDKNDRPLPLRSVRYERGVAIDPTLLAELLAEMEAIQWPRTTRERPKVSAEGYVILQRPPSPTATKSTTTSTTTVNAGTNTKLTKATNKAKREAEKIKRFIGIWTKAVEAIESVDKSFAQKFTALAVTKNFRGSPHIDTLNVAPFYGLALGDFTPRGGGGKLCVECSPTIVAEIDTRGRLAKVDGRFCHWVSDYEGTRYSLIYYVTSGDVIPQTTAIFEHMGNGEEEEDPSPWVPPPTFVL